MWLLPSKGRPEACQRALDAFATHGSTPGVLYVHDTFEEYRDIRLPVGWVKHEGHEFQAAQMQWFFGQYPDLDWYGWIADDNYAETADFDLELIRTAGRNCMVWCDGGRPKQNAKHLKGLCTEVPGLIPSCMVWGGDLVRRVGWWAPPWVNHGTIDEHWKHLVMHTNRARWRGDVRVRHEHWQDGNRPRDTTDHSSDFFSADIGAFEKWREGDEFKALVTALK